MIKTLFSNFSRLVRFSPTLKQDQQLEQALAELAESGLLDLDFYRLQLGEPELGWHEAAQHYLTIGYKNNLDPHPLFDTGFYMKTNAAISFDEINPLLHFLRFGWKENRDPHPLFGSEFYLQQNPDIAHAGMNPLMHFIADGAKQKREFSPYFDIDHYKNLLGVKQFYRSRGLLPATRIRTTYTRGMKALKVALPAHLKRPNNLLLHFLSEGAYQGIYPCHGFELYFELKPRQLTNYKGNHPLFQVLPKNVSDHGSRALSMGMIESMALNYGVEDDRRFNRIAEISCRAFHLLYRWDGYARTLRDDIKQIRKLSDRGDIIRSTAKVRSFLMLCSDPAIISFDHSADPVIAKGLRDFDIASIDERQLTGRLVFFLAFFGGYLKRAGDLASAERFYTAMTNNGFEAEGFCGLADIYHLLANWKAELVEYKEKGLMPVSMEVPHGFAEERIAKLDSYDRVQAISFYDKAVYSAPDVSFYRIHQGRALLNAGRPREAIDAFACAKKTPKPNPFADIYWQLVNCLIAKPCPAQRRGDFFPSKKLQRKFAEIRTVGLADSPMELGKLNETIALTKDEHLSVSYRSVTNGVSVSKTVEIFFPANAAVRLSMMRDLSFGLKLADESLLLAESRGLALSELKLFIPSLLLVGKDRAIIGLPEEPRNIRSEKILFTLPGVSFNYYHWLFDGLGAALLLERAAGLKDFELATETPLTSWQEESMAAALSKMPKHRVILDSIDNCIFENALHLPYPAKLNVPHPQAIRLLRERVSRHKSKPLPGKRIFLTRPLRYGRKTLNEAEIEKFLAKMGFLAVDTSAMSFSDQVDFFSDVEVIVASAGAALANTVFCPEQTRVVILSAAFHFQENFPVLGSILRQRWWICMAGCITRPNPYIIWSVLDQTPALQDVTVAVEEALEELPPT